MVSKPISVLTGTPGSLPLEYAFGFPQDLPRAEIFAFATTLFLDLDLDFVPSGYYPHLISRYLKEISSYIPSKRFSKCPSEEKNTAFNQWIQGKQIEHEENSPEDSDGQAYFAYRQLLWTALSPDFKKRPDAATFEKELTELYAKGELPA